MLSAFWLLATGNCLAQMAHNIPKHELRAVWLTTLNGLDWPDTRAADVKAAERQKRELTTILDRLKAANFNAVVMQTRIRGTVIYPSQIEPWDACLTGHIGQSPGYDPLAYAIEECHKRNMQLHAWVVAIPGNKTAQLKSLGAQALHRRKPHITLQTSEGNMLDPGVPETADYLAAICEEITRNYDIDGINLDYIRYPEKGIRFNDASTYRHHAKSGQSLADWRRGNTNRIVQIIHDRIKAIKPWVALSCSPVGKYADTRRQSAGGWNALNTVSQDAKLWVKEGWMDILMPMMYFRGNHYYPFALDWQESSCGHTIASGLGVYQIDRNQQDWPLAEMERQISYCRRHGLGGQVFFRSRFVTDNTKGIYDLLRDNLYRTPALPPALASDGPAPQPPTNARIEETPTGITLSWNPVEDTVMLAKPGVKGPIPQEARELTAQVATEARDTDSISDNKAAMAIGRCHYVLYRSGTYPVSTDDPNNIYKVGLTEPKFTINAPIPQAWLPYYAVTAIDRYGRESKPLQLNSPFEFEPRKFNYLQNNKNK